MTKSRKKQQKMLKNAEKRKSSSSTGHNSQCSNARLHGAPKNSGAGSHNFKEDPALCGDVNEAGTSGPSVDMKMQPVGYQTGFKGTEKSIQVHYLQDDVLTLLNKNKDLNNQVQGLMAEFHGRMLDFADQQHDFEATVKELVCQKQEQEQKTRKEEQKVMMLSGLLLAQSNWYFTFQKNEIMKHINECNKMIRDLAGAAAHMSTAGVLTPEYHQSIEQWRKELQKAKACSELFEEFQQRLTDNIARGNFRSLPEPPALLTQLCRPNDILHDSFIPAVNNMLVESQRTVQGFQQKTTLSTTYMNLNPLPSVMSSSIIMPNLLEDDTDLTVTAAAWNTNASAQEESNPVVSDPEPDAQTDTSTKLLDKAWFKRICRIHARSPNDEEQGQAANASSQVYQESGQTKQQQHQNKDDLSQFEAGVSCSRVQMLDGYENVCDENSSSPSEGPKQPSVRPVGRSNFENLVIYVMERVLNTTEPRLKAALKAVRKKRGGLSGMAKDEIVAAVQGELGVESVRNPTTACVQADPELECVICLEWNDDPMTVLKCRHSFHVKCITTCIRRDPLCPICRMHVSPDEDIFL